MTEILIPSLLTMLAVCLGYVMGFAAASQKSTDRSDR